MITTIIALSCLGCLPVSAGTHSGPSPSVLIFMLKDCPIAQQYLLMLGKMGKDLKRKHIQFKIEFEDSNLSEAIAKRHLKQYNCDLPFQIDQSHSIAKKWKATVSPEVFFIGSNSKILYHGRIDDRYMALGSPRPAATRHDLSNAIQQWIQHKPILVPYSEPIGCILEI